MNKNKADDTKKISTSFLNKHKFLVGRRSGNMTWTTTSMWSEHKSEVGIEVSIMNDDNYLRIRYNQTDRDTNEKKEFDYKIPLTTTHCQYGGKRYWFICPWYKNGVYCGKRVGTLYKDGDYFACRHCYNLTYASRNTSRKYRNFVSLPDVEKAESEVKRYYYKGNPTKKYKRLLKLTEKFENGFLRMCSKLI